MKNKIAKILSKFNIKFIIWETPNFKAFINKRINIYAYKTHFNISLGVKTYSLPYDSRSFSFMERLVGGVL